MTESRSRLIVLIGLRGSGKTTVGRILAELMVGRCVDADDIIQTEAGMTIAEIFRREGEAGFRRRERDTIARILTDRPDVFSVGGGAVLDESTAEALGEAATIVWLTAPAELLWQRISTDPSSAASRPALTDLDGVGELEKLVAERAAIYERTADLVVETDGLTAREVAQAIVDKIKAASRP